MKRITAILTIACSLTSNAEAATTQAQDMEKLCLSTAVVAGNVARVRKVSGMTEEQLMGQYERLLAERKDMLPATKTVAKNMFNSVITFVYSLQLDEADARRMVYAKCKDGEYS